PSLALLGVPSSASIVSSTETWSAASRPTTSGAMRSATLATARVTPLPRKRAPSPSRSSSASCSPVEAPEGTAARPRAPPARTTSASTVGLPRESRISRARTSRISVMAPLSTKRERWERGRPGRSLPQQRPAAVRRRDAPAGPPRVDGPRLGEPQVGEARGRLTVAVYGVDRVEVEGSLSLTRRDHGEPVDPGPVRRPLHDVDELHRDRVPRGVMAGAEAEPLCRLDRERLEAVAGALEHLHVDDRAVLVDLEEQPRHAPHVRQDGLLAVRRDARDARPDGHGGRDLRPLLGDPHHLAGEVATQA